MNTLSCFPLITTRLNIRREHGVFLASSFNNHAFTYIHMSALMAKIASLCTGQHSVEEIAKAAGSTSAKIKQLCGKFSKILTFSKTSTTKYPVLMLDQPSDNEIKNDTKPFFKTVSIDGLISPQNTRLSSPLFVYFEILKNANTQTCLKILDQFAQAKVLEVCFCGKAVDHPDILQLTQYAKKLQMKVFVHMKKMDKADIAQLQTFAKQDIDLLRIPFHGADEQMQHLIEPDCDFEKLQQNIRKAIELKIPSEAFCTINKENLKHAYRVLKKVKQLGFTRFRGSISEPDPKKYKDPAIFKLLSFGFFGYRTIEITFKLLNKIMPSLNIRTLEACSAATTDCKVDSNGVIGPCIVMKPYQTKHIFGTIFEKDLKSIWNGQKFHRFLNPQNYAQPCASCSFPSMPIIRKLPRCRADCRRRIFMQTGDLFAGHKRCKFGFFFSKSSRQQTIHSCLSRLRQKTFLRKWQ